MKLSPPTHRVTAKLVDYLSPPRLTNLLVGLILFFSSTQLGFHLWPSNAFVYGVRVDYLSPTIYFLDLLILVYLLAVRGSDLTGSAQPQAKRSGRSDPMGTLLPLLLTNLLFSANPLATLSWSFHLVLYLLFVFSVSPIILNSLFIILPIVMFFQVVLGGIQTFLGHTLQGPFYWLGERVLSVGSPAVAKAEWLGRVTLRAYGTFSHPNILAGWLVVACLITLILSRNTKYKILNITLSSFGLLLTQSRSAALAFFGIVLPFYLLRSLHSRLIYFVILSIPLFIILSSSFKPSFSDLSVSERLSLQKTSFSVIRSYPIFGTGANASISTYPAVSPSLRLLQPDHDSFTLLLSWFGLVGIFAVLSLLRFIKIPNIKYQILNLLPLLLFDHYLLTSPQGLFILLLYLRLVGLQFPKPVNRSNVRGSDLEGSVQPERM